MARNNAKGFVFRFEWLEALKDESPETTASFVKDICEFARDGRRRPRVPASYRLLYNLAANAIENDLAKYAKRTEKAANMARKRWDKALPPPDAVSIKSMPKHETDANLNLNLNPNLNPNLNSKNTQSKCSDASAFSVWWESYPNEGINAGRRINRAECEKIWREKHLDDIASDVMRATRYWAQIAENDAARGAKHGIVMTTTFLNQERWHDVPANAFIDDKQEREDMARRWKEKWMKAVADRKETENLRGRIREIQARRDKGFFVAGITLPCKDCSSAIELSSETELDGYLNGRNICRNCYEKRLNALPKDKADSLRNLSAKYSKLIFDGQDASAVKAELDKLADSLVFRI